MTNFNAQALANTARTCASIANSVSGTIKSIVTHWNLCCQQVQMEDFTTEAHYTRRAFLAADMLRMAEQLDNIANGAHPITGQTKEEAHAEAFKIALQMRIEADLEAGRPVCEETGADLREWSGESIERDHAEALEMNDARNTLYVYAPGDAARNVWELMTPTEQAVSLELRHAEALAFNAEVDEVAAANQWDKWANQHDSRKTEAQMIESDHAEALAFDAEYNRAAEMAAAHLHQYLFYTLRPWIQSILFDMAHDAALLENDGHAMHIANPAQFASYNSWLARQRAAGRQLIKYSCPNCETEFQALTPPTGDAHDSFCTCPVCAGGFFRIVDNENGNPVISIHSTAQHSTAAEGQAL